jgi:hypothetical protein
MGVLSLHNECPPLDYGSDDAKAICHGLILGEEGTSATLKALADCLNALAAIDDTVGNVVAAWSAALSGADGNDMAARMEAVQASYTRSFEALAPTIDRIDFAGRKYRELEDYAISAADAGRGEDFQAALIKTAGDDFETLVDRRIERLRNLRIRVNLLHQLQGLGIQTLGNNDFPTFFMLFMEPLRDLAIAVDMLYSEVVRGALASKQALFRVARLPGWEGNGAVSPDGAAQVIPEESTPVSR